MNPMMNPQQQRQSLGRRATSAPLANASSRAGSNTYAAVAWSRSTRPSRTARLPTIQATHSFTSQRHRPHHTTAGQMR